VSEGSNSQAASKPWSVPSGGGSHDPVERVYERLTPLERLRAVISALPRGRDLVERHRLQDSCVRKHYTVVDYQFSGRAELLDLMVLARSTDVYAKAFRTTVAMAILLVPEHELPDGDELTEEQETQWNNYERLTENVQQLNAVVEGWERGFERFCKALGFDADEARRAIMSLVSASWARRRRRWTSSE
jgi:hypothetical protein